MRFCIWTPLTVHAIEGGCLSVFFCYDKVKQLGDEKLSLLFIRLDDLRIYCVEH